MSAAAQLRRRLILLGLATLVLVSMALAWQWSPLRVWLDVDILVQTLKQSGQDYGPVAAIFGLAIGLTMAVPLTFLTVVAIVALGPAMGLACCLIGAQFGAIASYYLGAYLGRDVVRKLGGQQINAISISLAQRGFLAVVAIRMVPVAPFAVINMLAGASHIRIRDLLLGTFVGMLPGALAIAYFVNQIVDTLRQPSATNLSLLALGLPVIALGAWLARRWLRKTQMTDQQR